MRSSALKVVADVEPTRSDPHELGRRIRLLRQSRKLPLQAVADASGISIGLLSQVERGLSSPSVRNLVALSDALGVKIGWFFDEAMPIHERERRLIMRREARPSIAMPVDSISKEALTPDRDSRLQSFILTIQPGGDSGEIRHGHAGDVNGYVLTGRLDLWLEAQSFSLRSGDSFAIPGQTPRRYGNPDRFEITQLIWSIAYTRSSQSGSGAS